MIRAAAKNFKYVGVVTRPEDYRLVIDELKSGGVLTDATKRTLARKAFAHTAAYDASIVAWFDEASDAPLPPTLQFGNASFRVRVSQYVVLSGVAVLLKYK